MKNLVLIFCTFFFQEISAQIQPNNFLRKNDTRKVLNEALAPFYHGVASGDPTQNSVIIWTRVTPETNEETILVDWFVSSDTTFAEESLVEYGQFETNIERDFTVKVDVENLEAGTIYYYAFRAFNQTSIMGRTKTAPTNSDHLRFAIVSCSNYQHGYFNSYARIAEKHDLDAVIHLGDYIYEYGNDTDSTNTRFGIEPAEEIIELIDYRTRHSFYKLDNDLMKMHQQHPMIAVWDDHEVANDSWIDGAENHQEATEGDYQERKSKAKQAYFEWMPIRDNDAKSVYRKFDFGELADLIMIDTRHEARMEQVDTLGGADHFAEDRTLLGEAQKEWFIEQLDNSTSQWKLIGNQVFFSPVAYQTLLSVNEAANDLFSDVWEGYPVERQSILEHISTENINNIAVLTGDIHAAFANDISIDPTNPDVYNPETGEGSIAVEFITPSVSSNNFDEYLGEQLAGLLSPLLLNTNPQVKTGNFVDHGYYVLDVTSEKIQADWYLDPDRTTPSDSEIHTFSFFSNSDENHLNTTETESEGKENEIPASDTPPTIDLVFFGTDELLQQKDVVILGTYPNPFYQENTISYALNKKQNISIEVFDMTGKKIETVFEGQQNKGLYTFTLNTKNWASGNYFYQIKTESGVISERLIKVE